MDGATGTPGPLPKKYIGTYLAKPVTGSISTTPSWTSFINTRMGPTAIGVLPSFLDEFYRVHVGKLDPKFEIFTRALRQCNQVTRSVFWFLEQGPVRNKSDKMFLLKRALFRNHGLWNKVADALRKCIDKSPGVIYLFLLGRKSSPFDTQHSGAAKIFLQKVVKKLMRDPRSCNLFKRSFLIDEIREYILTTGMLVRDIEDELDGRTTGPESGLGPASQRLRPSARATVPEQFSKRPSHKTGEREDCLPSAVPSPPKAATWTAKTGASSKLENNMER